MLKLIANKIGSFILFLIFITYTGSLVGCATERSLGYGTVLEQSKIEDKNYKPQKRTLAGAGIGIGTGAGVGALGGGAAGAIAGAGAGAVMTVLTFGLAAPMIPAFTAAGMSSGAASGALIGGAAGGVIGAGTGYAADLHYQGKGFYQFTIKLDQQPTHPVTIMQYADQLMPPHTRVQLIKNQDQILIKPMGKGTAGYRNSAFKKTR